MELLGIDEKTFIEWINDGKFKLYFNVNKTYVVVENVVARTGSLYAAHLQTIITEFKEQIKKPSSAYIAKILTKNQGGFFIEVQGVKAFLPGSLAAANKIIDFEEYLGKTINVMVEDYLESSDIFIFSYKKYIEYILPSEIAKLAVNSRITGLITGTSKFGVFAEFNELFTGLLHTSEMNPETLDKFTKGKYKSGMEITVWLKEVKDNRLILTENDPMIKQNEMEIFKEKMEGKKRLSTIVSIKPHGALMEIEPGVIGLLPVKEMKKTGKKLSVNDKIEVTIKRVDTTSGKIYLTANEDEALREESKRKLLAKYA